MLGEVNYSTIATVALSAGFEAFQICQMAIFVGISPVQILSGEIFPRATAEFIGVEKTFPFLATKKLSS